MQTEHEAFATTTRSLEISPASGSPLQVGGKRLGHWLLATSVAGHLPSRLLYISDRKTGRRFLVDTGAEVSVIPPTAADRKHKQDLGQRAVYVSPIPTYGTLSITLDLGLRRAFRWIFIVADIQTPILKDDFLREYGLLMNLRQGCLLDATTSLQSKGITVRGKILEWENFGKWQAIRQNFPCQYF